MYKDYELPKSGSVWDTLVDKPAHQRVWSGDAYQEDRENLHISCPELLGCNSYVDAEIGRVLEAIDEHAADTLVIYTSDHGCLQQAHSLTGKGPAMYDEITRIPFIVRWPGEAPANSVCPHPVSHIDVVPTIMEAFGMPPGESLEGASMLATLESPHEKPNETIFMEFGRYEVDHDGFGGFQPIRAAFDGRYNLVVNLLTTDELYDMENDPDEVTNLIESSSHTKFRDALHDRMLDWMNETRDPFRGYYWERRPWRKNAREATWAYTSMTRQRLNTDYEPRQLDYDTGLEMTAPNRRK
jgi:uncharacterized sulfatase